MNLLLIDTSNQPMSIALMNDDEVLAIKQQIVKASFEPTYAWYSILI